MTWTAAGLLVAAALAATLHRRGQRLQAAARARLAATFDALPDATLVLDADGTVTAANPAAGALLDQPRTRLVGRGLGDLFGGSAAAAAILDSDEPSAVDGLHCQAVRADGRQTPVELAVTARRLPGQRSYLLRAHDLTVQRRVEEALRRSEAGLQDAQRIARIGQIDWDVDSGAIRWSQEVEAIFGRTSAHGGPTYEAYLDAVHPDDRPGVEAALQRSRASGEPYALEHRVLRADGVVAFVHAEGRVELEADGRRVAAVVGTIQDVTEQRRVEHELRLSRDVLERQAEELRRQAADLRALARAEAEARVRAERAAAAKGEFLANMSHEIRTPMNAIVGLTHLALRADPSERLRGYLTKIGSAGEALLAVVNDVLDFSKVDAGKLTLEATPFTLEQVFERVHAVVDTLAQAKGLHLSLHADPELRGALVGDPLRLGQVLINLTNNAVKFTERGSVEVSVERRPGAGSGDVRLGFAVSDTGIGIDPARAGHLFEGFVQADGSTTRRYGGTGLGLAISRQLVRLMGGELTVESEPGAGSVFSFELSLANASEAQLAGEPDVALLVVEEGVPGDARLRRAVEALPLAATWVGDLEEALVAVQVAARASARPPFATILFAPDPTDGASAVEAVVLRLRGLSTDTWAPAVVVATADDEVAERARRAGAEVVAPPFELARLAEETRPVPAASAAALLEGVSLLVAEDNAVNQMVVREVLEQAGATVDVADDGDDALAQLRAAPRRYDAVLLDIQMPRRDGLSTARAIREDLGRATLPLIALTAHAFEAERRRCLAAGMNAHVTKPFVPGELVAAVGRCLGRTPTGPAPGPLGAAPSQERAAAVAARGGRPALDVAALRARIPSVAVLCRILEQFVALGEVDDELEASLAAGDVAAAQRRAHSVKGVAGSLCALRLYDATVALEGGLADAADDARPALLAAFRAELRRAMLAGRELLGELSADDGLVGAGTETARGR